MDALGLLLIVGIVLYLENQQAFANLWTPAAGSSGGPVPPPGGGGAVPVTSSSNVVQRLAQAIAQAEGFYVAGSIPQRQNNPGDLAPAGTILTYPTAADGWAALYAQVQSMFDGTSAYYNPSMTIAQVGRIYAGGDPNWAANVASSLGVSTDTTLSQLSQLM